MFIEATRLDDEFDFRDLLDLLVLFLLDVAIIFVVMVTVGLSYYCYKLKTENRIEPSEEVR